MMRLPVLGLRAQFCLFIAGSFLVLALVTHAVLFGSGHRALSEAGKSGLSGNIVARQGLVARLPLAKNADGEFRGVGGAGPGQHYWIAEADPLVAIEAGMTGMGGRLPKISRQETGTGQELRAIAAVRPHPLPYALVRPVLPPAVPDRLLRRGFVLVSAPIEDGRWLAGITASRPSAVPRPLIFIAVVTAFLFGAIILMTQWRIISPLCALSSAVESFRETQSGGAVPERGAREIRQLAQAFNAMQSRVSNSVRDRMRLLAGIGHDLNSPLAALQWKFKRLGEGALGEEQERVLKLLEELEGMSSAILSYSRETFDEEPFAPVDLTSLVAGVVEDYQMAGGKVAFAETARVIVRGRELAIRRALRNLIDNAEHYAGSSEVRLKSTAESVSLIVED